MGRRQTVFAAILAAAGCGMGLPLEERIASTRPLALRVEVVETLEEGAPVRAEALPFETVRIVPLFVDPEGTLSLDEVATEIEPVWLACVLQPIEGLFSCLSDRLPLKAADVPDCPDIDPSMLDPAAGEFPMVPNPCWITGGTPAQPEFRVPLDATFLLGGDLEVTMVGHIPGAGTTAGCVDQLLGEAGSLSSDCIFTTQRVAVGPDAQLLQLAVDFGLPDAEQFGAVPEQIPDADTHPRIQSFTVRVFDENDNEVGVFMPSRGERLEAKAGQRIDIETVASEDDLQTYLIPRDMTAFDERTESYDGRWFTTWGTLLSSVSDDPLSLNSWTLNRGEQDEDDLPPAGRATMFYVLRDDRQGVDWWWFQLDITE